MKKGGNIRSRRRDREQYEDELLDFDEELFSVNMDNSIMYVNDRVLSIDAAADIIKPYLRPMSSMNEDEKVEYNKTMFQSERYISCYSADIDFLNSHHFDYRGLIKKELALEAPEGMYKTE